MDLFRQGSTDFVDNPYWSAMQIQVKRLTQQEAEPLGDTDLGKVLLIAHMTLDKRESERSEHQLSEMRRLAEKYKNDLAVYNQFAYDVQGGEEMTNRQIATHLIQKAMLTQVLKPGQIRFLEKVRSRKDEVSFRST